MLPEVTGVGIACASRLVYEMIKEKWYPDFVPKDPREGNLLQRTVRATGRVLQVHGQLCSLVGFLGTVGMISCFWLRGAELSEGVERSIALFAPCTIFSCGAFIVGDFLETIG